jgi:hypothetical protein
MKIKEFQLEEQQEETQIPDLAALGVGCPDNSEIN